MAWKGQRWAQVYTETKVENEGGGVNTASASKVGQFRPFLGEVKKLKGPLMSIFLFKYRNVGVQLLRQHWMHFVRDHSTCWMLQMRRYKSGLC